MKIKLADIADGTLSSDQSGMLHKYFQNGGTWQELLQLKIEDVEEVYAKGYRYYKEGDFDKALAAFSSLIQLNPYVSKHWISIGAVQQAKEEYAEALFAYELALSMEETNISALFFSAQCLYALERIQETKEALKKIVSSPISEKEGSKEERHYIEKAGEILKLLGLGDGSL